MPRRRYLDWARGLAVLIMIEAHTLDSWTAPAERSTTAFRSLMLLGGFAAPLFLFLAGIGVVISGSRVASGAGRWGAGGPTIVRRGLFIFALAFLFRAQALIVSPGGPLTTFFRVDILNIMGIAMFAAGLVWTVSRSRAQFALACVAAASGIAMISPLVRTAPWVGALPALVQRYLLPHGGEEAFTLLPWSGFLFAGAAWAATLPTQGDERANRGAHLLTAGGGTVLVAAGVYAASRPSLHAASAFWTTSPTFFAIRVGALLGVLAATYAAVTLGRRRGVALEPLAHMGRASLFVYWIHVELVYGYASWPLHSSLGVWQALTACVAFSALMYGAVVTRDRLTNNWRNTHLSGVPPDHARV